MLREGFLDPKEAGREESVPDSAGGGFYTFVGRDGQARWTGIFDGSKAEVFLG